MDEKEKQVENKSDLNAIVLDKILELQSSSFNSKEQLSSLLSFVQSLLGIETIALYANFAGEQINLINSTSGKTQYASLGQLLELISDEISFSQSKYFNSLIPVSELNIKNLPQADSNTFVYPIVSPLVKQIYGVVLITNPKLINNPYERKIFLFVLNYITKIIEEADLAKDAIEKDNRLKLLSRLSGLLHGILKADRAVEIVLNEIYNFLKLEDVYFVRWAPEAKRLNITQEVISDGKHSLKGFLHKVSNNNPIIKLLYKNQFVTFRNKNVKKICKLFLGSKVPSLFCLVPVLIRKELLGAIICVNTKEGHEVSTDDLNIAQDISGHLAVILNQSSLYEESLSTAQREFLLNSITTMIRDTLEINSVLEKTAQEVGQVFGVNACGAFLRKDDESDFTVRSVWATEQKYKDKLLRLPLSPSILPDPISQSVSISDMSSVNFGELKPFIDEFGCKSYLACSLNKGNKTIGVLVLAHFDLRRNWTSSEVQLIEAISDQVEIALSQAELHEHVKRTERQMNLLHQVSTAIRDSLNLSTVMARAAQDLGEILSSSRCFIRRLRSINPLSVLATEQEYVNKDHNVDKACDLILGFEEEWLSSLSKLPEVDRANTILNISDVPEKYKGANDPLKTIIETIQIKSFLGVPLVAAGQVIGCLCIHQCDRNRKFTHDEIEFAKRVASEASVAVLNADLFTKAQYQAQRDSLTGLYNHAYFQTALHHEAERAKRTGSDLSVIMVDIDYLKLINDKYGHVAGDEAITLTSGKLQQCLRQMDIVARYGGDEFAILLPETDIEKAEMIGKRILDTLNRTMHSNIGPINASIGIAGTPHEERNKEDIMKAADDALYISKKEGRNRLTTSTTL